MHYSHIAQFTQSEDALIAGAVEYLRNGLAREGRCVVATCTSRRKALQGQVPDDGSVLWLDAHEILGHIFRAGRIDPYEFELRVGEVIRGVIARSGARPIFAYGDMVGRLWQDGYRSAAADLEWYWDDLGTQLPFTLYCSYPIDGSAPADDDVRRIAHLHSAVVA